MEEVRKILESCFLDLAQLHGDESAEFCAALGNKAFKAFRGIPEGGVKSYVRNGEPAFLVDAAVSGSYGGTGLIADWSAAAELAKCYPLLLAGGLRLENVAEAVGWVKPWGVDVASGVEGKPGEKDPDKIKAFVEEVRRVEKRD